MSYYNVTSLLALLLLLVSNNNDNNAAILVVEAAYKGIEGEVECVQQGWGLNIGGSSKRTAVIPSDWMNDGYCDCPFDGLDEPNTNACSGSTIGGWAGVNKQKDDTNHQLEGLTFQCTDQPKKFIPVSNLNDGICDCCDGSDETTSTTKCENICDIVMKAERLERLQTITEFKTGNEKLVAETTKFETLVEKTRMDILSLDQKKDEIQNRFREATKNLQNWKNSFLRQKHQKIMSAIADSQSETNVMLNFLDALSNDELAQFLILSCQISGEVDVFVATSTDNQKGSSTSPTSTCIPLRLAGVDIGYLWDEENFDKGNVQGMWYQEGEQNDEEKANYDNYNYSMLARIAYWNSINIINNKVWHSKGLLSQTKKNSKSHHRRLEEVDDDYTPNSKYSQNDDDGVYDDNDHYPEPENDYDYKNHAEADENHRNRGKKDHEKEETKELEGKQKELFDAIEGSKFSESRKRFLKHAENILSHIDDILNSADDEDNDDDEKKDESSNGEGDDDAKEEEAISDDGSDSNSTIFESKDNISVDPMAYLMVRNTLNSRIQAIRNGMDYAISATVLLSTVNRDSFSEEEQIQQAKDDMIALAVGTIYHGQLSTLHVWQILSKILPGLLLEQEQQEQTCSAATIHSCPPQAIQRSIKSKSHTFPLTIPPHFMMTLAEEFCTKTIEMLSDDDNNFCSGEVIETGDNDTKTGLGDIPTSIPDFYHGYHNVESRKNDDMMNALFHEWETPIDDEMKDEIEQFETDNDQLLNSKKVTEKDIEKLKESVDIDNKSNEEEEGYYYNHKFGKHGELYALKDKCFDVLANKYTYEVCIFGSSTQREGSSKSGGTNLGKWAGMDENFDSAENGDGAHQLILRWEGGAKCWNGPQRSATVYATCGADTKVISAEEPETCKYVLEMETYIACNDHYRAHHNL